jgi:hypothetical protein
VNRQAVSLLILGERGPGGFPPPAARVTSDSPLWDWLTVVRWLKRHGRLRDRMALVQAAMIREINGILEMRREHQPGERILERARGARLRLETSDPCAVGRLQPLALSDLERQST